MRISAGVAKGRRIGFKKAFSSRKSEAGELRPTSSKVRQALFDIIRDRIDGAVFLDLYAGTGSIGIEALSRGSRQAVFVESDRLRIKMIEQLLSEFRFRDQAKVVAMNARNFVDREAKKGKRYDIIFLDPPYHSEELMEILPRVGKGTILKEDGLVIAEHFSKMKLPEVAGNLRLVRSYRYGDTMLTVYKTTEEREL